FALGPFLVFIMHSLQGIAMKVKRYACDRCHSQKLRCPRSSGEDGLQKPCVRCQKARTSCNISAMQKTGRPRKKARVTPQTSSTQASTPQYFVDGADSSTESPQNLECEANTAPQSTVQSRAHSPRIATLEQAFDRLPSSSSGAPIESLETHQFTCAMDDYTGFLTFDDPLTDVPSTVDKEIQWTEKGSAQELDKPVDILASHSLNDRLLSQEESGLQTSSESATSVLDMSMMQSDLMEWERLDRGMNKPRVLVDSGTSTPNSSFSSPFLLDRVSSQPPTANICQTHQIHDIKVAKKSYSPHQTNCDGSSVLTSENPQPIRAPPLTNCKFDGAYSDMGALLQIQFELHTYSKRLVTLETTSQHGYSTNKPRDSQSEMLGKLFSIAERFISLVSEAHGTYNKDLPPEYLTQSSSTSTPNIENMPDRPFEHPTGRTLFPVAQHKSYPNARPYRCAFGSLALDPAALHLVSAFHIRLIAAYEVIVDAIAAQSQFVDKTEMAPSPNSSLSIGGFTVRPGTSLESLLHLQIIFHQLGRLGDVCDAYFSRMHTASPCKGAVCCDSLRGLHERRRRAAPTAFRDMAKRMVEERETALRSKIRGLACRPHYALDIDSFCFAEEAS
ncbi:MAG: hypothetical protein Q9214_004461, partial [Letrouitia sp. 1 TL-2023]